MQDHQAKEQDRTARLAAERARYERECQERDQTAAASNAELDRLIDGLERNEEAAVQQYVSIVLGNSVYPDCFPVEHDFDFDLALRELSLRVTIPGPQSIPPVKNPSIRLRACSRNGRS
jgi:restriction system protein